MSEVAFTTGLTFAGSSGSFPEKTRFFVPFERFLSFSSFLASQAPETLMIREAGSECTALPSVALLRPFSSR